MRRKLVVIHQHDGPSIEGVWRFSLSAYWRHEYALIHASLREAEDITTPLDGEVRIPRERVYFRQLVARSA